MPSVARSSGSACRPGTGCPRRCRASTANGRSGSPRVWATLVKSRRWSRCNRQRARSTAPAPSRPTMSTRPPKRRLRPRWPRLAAWWIRATTTRGQGRQDRQDRRRRANWWLPRTGESGRESAPAELSELAEGHSWNGHTIAGHPAGHRLAVGPRRELRHDPVALDEVIGPEHAKRERVGGDTLGRHVERRPVHFDLARVPRRGNGGGAFREALGDQAQHQDLPRARGGEILEQHLVVREAREVVRARRVLADRPRHTHLDLAHAAQ